jgi:hypothetical protein
MDHEKKFLCLNTWQKYMKIKNTLWHLMLNCCESRVALRLTRGKRGKWNRPRVLHIIDNRFIINISLSTKNKNDFFLVYLFAAFHSCNATTTTYAYNLGRAITDVVYQTLKSRIGGLN